MHPSQPACIDATFRHDHLVGLTPFSTPTDHQVPLPSDDTLASTAKVPIICNTPYHKAINASDWATLATRPDTMPSDANGSMAVDLCTTSVYMFPYDGSTGTTTKPSLRQESEDINPLPVIRSDHIALTHSDEKASQHHSPGADTIVDRYATLRHTSPTNGSMTRDRHTILGHASSIDSSITPASLKQVAAHHWERQHRSNTQWQGGIMALQPYVTHMPAPLHLISKCDGSMATDWHTNISMRAITHHREWALRSHAWWQQGNAPLQPHLRQFQWPQGPHHHIFRPSQSPS
jgi:hypothetical protein